MSNFGLFSTISFFFKMSQVQAFIIHNWHHIQQSADQNLREQFLLFHSLYNTLLFYFPYMNDSCPILAYFGAFLSSSKVSQVQAFMIHNWHHLRQTAEQYLTEQFLLFFSIYNTLQCSFPNLNDICPILAYFGTFLSSSKGSQIQAFIIRNWHHTK